jgi:hypothetical protein
MSNLRAEVCNADGKLTIALCGAIDEDTDLDAALAAIDQDVILELSGIHRINSIGVHRWVRSLGSLCGKFKVSVEACPYAMALQANVVRNFFAGAEIQSCLAPYFCAKCHRNLDMLIEAQELVSPGIPDKSCPTCKGPLEFDELDAYFAFMRQDRAGV